MTLIQVKYKIKIVEKSNDGGKNWSPLRYFRKSISEIMKNPINMTGRQVIGQKPDKCTYPLEFFKEKKSHRISTVHLTTYRISSLRFVISLLILVCFRQIRECLIAEIAQKHTTNGLFIMKNTIGCNRDASH